MLSLVSLPLLLARAYQALGDAVQVLLHEIVVAQDPVMQVVQVVAQTSAEGIHKLQVSCWQTNVL